MIETGNRDGWRRLLEAVPVRNTAARVEQVAPDERCVHVVTARPWFLKIPPLSWIVPGKGTRATLLDKLGGEVLDLCDGARSVEEIVDIFAGRHALSFHESRAAVTGYLKSLVQRGILAVDVGERPCRP